MGERLTTAWQAIKSWSRRIALAAGAAVVVVAGWAIHDPANAGLANSYEALEADYGTDDDPATETPSEIDLEQIAADQQADARRLIAQLLAGALAAVALFYNAVRARAMEGQLRNAERQAAATERGQITERFTKAVEQLGNPEAIDIRIGGVYALEGIAQEATRLGHHAAGIEPETPLVVLEAFLRRRPSPIVGDDPEPMEADWQAAAEVVGRSRRYMVGRRINLFGADLSGAVLIGANFSNALLSLGRMRGAEAFGADLSQAIAVDADLAGALLFDANLSEIVLSGSNLTGASLAGSDLSGADLTYTDLCGADLSRANLSGVKWGETKVSYYQLESSEVRKAVEAGLALVSDTADDEVAE